MIPVDYVTLYFILPSPEYVQSIKVDSEFVEVTEEEGVGYGMIAVQRSQEVTITTIMTGILFAGYDINGSTYSENPTQQTFDEDAEIIILTE